MKKNKTWVLLIIIAVANLNDAAGQTSDNLIEEGIQPNHISSFKMKNPDEVTITGYIKDKDGNPLAYATVSTVQGKKYLTDNNGKFSFKLEQTDMYVQNIFASCDGLVTAVRSYDPAMQEPFYDIILYKPSICCPRKHIDSLTSTPSAMHFKTTGSELSGETRKDLNSISSILKESPEKKIYITVYPGARKSLQRLADAWLAAVIRYLTEHIGISSDRIITKKLTGIDNSNSVDIRIE